MQIIFNCSVSPEEYYRQGKHFPFPAPETCLNPHCMLPKPPVKHGFYSRGCNHVNFSEMIPIRRYRCKKCGMTFSYLPSFCLPYYQYSLWLIYLFLQDYFVSNYSLKGWLDLIRPRSFPYLNRQHLYFYYKRFLDNLDWIKQGLRLVVSSSVVLPDARCGPKKKEAAKVLEIAKSGPGGIHAFSQRFFAQYRHSFMAPYKNYFSISGAG